MGSNGNLTVCRMESAADPQWPRLLDLVDKAEGASFDITDFIRWTDDSMHNLHNLVLYFEVDKEPAGFLIASAPSHLYHYVWVHYGYCIPKFRSLTTLKKGLSIVLSWAHLFDECDGIAFNSPRPRAWSRVFNSRIYNGVARLEVPFDGRRQ